MKHNSSEIKFFISFNEFLEIKSCGSNYFEKNNIEYLTMMHLLRIIKHNLNYK